MADTVEVPCPKNEAGSDVQPMYVLAVIVGVDENLEETIAISTVGDPSVTMVFGMIAQAQRFAILSANQ